MRSCCTGLGVGWGFKGNQSLKPGRMLQAALHPGQASKFQQLITLFTAHNTLTTRNDQELERPVACPRNNLKPQKLATLAAAHP